MSAKKSDPAREIIRAVKLSFETLLLCILLLLPVAWCITKGLIPMEGKRVFVETVTFLSAFLTKKLQLSQERGGVLRAAGTGASFYCLLLLLNAGWKGSVLSPGNLLPVSLWAVFGYLLAGLSVFNKKYSPRKRGQKTHYKK